MEEIEQEIDLDQITDENLLQSLVSILFEYCLIVFKLIH